jgi:hypothetical protein
VPITPDMARALVRLPFTPLGPSDWRRCRRAMPGHAYGPRVGFQHLLLAHVRTGAGGDEVLAVGTGTGGGGDGDGVEASVQHALSRMTALNDTATTTYDGPWQLDVCGVERAMRLVLLDDGQWSAFATDAGPALALTGAGWPHEGLALVAVDPIDYVDEVTSG